MDTSQAFLFVAVVILALAFDYINGFHDAANAIATVVSTKVMTPRVAVLFGGVLNFVGALLGTEVAATIGKGLVDPSEVTMPTVLCALIGAIAWNILTWYWGLPTSSSHALIGSLLGATAFASATGLSHIHWPAIGGKVLTPMVVSPTLGFAGGMVLMGALTWVVFKLPLPLLNRVFGKLQILSAGFMALSHGHNDAQKSMGIIALALVTLFPSQHFEVPLWVMVTCAIAMGLGTMTGGWKIIRTLGSKMIKLQPIHGFAAETTAAGVITWASSMGIPLSTTHVITSTIMGVGATKRLSAVKWGVVGRILWAWVLTLPLTFLFAGLVRLALKPLLG